MRNRMIIRPLTASGILLFCLTGMISGGFSKQMEGPDNRSVTILFWNLENFFDFIDGGTGESDAEFSATGPRRWTKKRFYRKCQALAKTILWAGSDTSPREKDAGHAGLGGDTMQAGSGWDTGLPDIVGMAEVENRFVLQQLVTKTALRKLDYEIVHFDSPDPRGIDCALLYRASRLTLVSAKPCRVSAPELRTRDILLAQFRTPGGDSLAVLVNHHPSKYGGGETDWRREVAVARLRALGDSLAAAGWTRAVAVGDFNDVPEDPVFNGLGPAFSLCRLEGGRRGSIRFNGEWQLIDLCFVSPALAGAASFSVLEPPFLTERDAAHSGDKPLRTYSGPRYLGGVSDHRPILVRIFLPSPRRASTTARLRILSLFQGKHRHTSCSSVHPSDSLEGIAPSVQDTLPSSPRRRYTMYSQTLFQKRFYVQAVQNKNEIEERTHSSYKKL